MLKKYINASLICFFVLCVAGCAEVPRGSPSAQDHNGVIYDVALKWTGDDGLSISFKHAIRDVVKLDPMFRLSYYDDADIVIDNTSNVSPLFSSDGSIYGFSYHVIVHYGISSYKNADDFGAINGKCVVDSVDDCASHLVNVIKKKLVKK